jgi:hypothetical protein
VLGVAKNGVPFRLLSLFSFFGAPKNGVPLSPNAVLNECKALVQADRRTYKKPKKNLKTHNNQTHKPQNLKKG